MIFIAENTIDKFIESFENDKIYNSYLEQIYKDQKDLMAFIDVENQSLLTQDEAVMLEYLTMTIYYSACDQCGKISMIRGKDLEEAEEKNWEIFNANSSGSFTKIIDKYFEGYQQEDLLALVEDSLQPDEDQLISSVGREIIFVACKSIIDVIHQGN